MPRQRERALTLLKENGVMRLRELTAVGIHAQTISRLVKEGVVMQVARGLYELSDADISGSHTLAEVAKVIPGGVICLLSALEFHEITLQLPSRVWVAIGHKAWRPRYSYPPIRVVRFGKKAHSMSIERHFIDGVEVPIFSPAKTVVDCFRYRSTVGLDVALEGMRMAVRRRKAHPNDIYQYARELRIWSILRPYLEATLADEG